MCIYDLTTVPQHLVQCLQVFNYYFLNEEINKARRSETLCCSSQAILSSTCLYSFSSSLLPPLWRLDFNFTG